jgi:hypothetical protein
VPVPDRQEAVREIAGQAENSERMAETKTSKPAGGKQTLDESKDPTPRASTEDSTSATLPRPSQTTRSQPTTVAPKQAAPTGPPGQELDGDSETATAEASERRLELSPRDQARVETEPKSPPVVTETASRSAAEMKPILPSTSEAKPAESKDSAGSVQSKLRLGDIEHADSRPERPLDLPDKAETKEMAGTQPAADSTSSEERAGEPRHSPAEVASKLIETAAPTPPVAQVTPQELARAAEARDVLTEGLRERGASVHVIPLYDTVAEPVDGGALSTATHITFTSSSTVRFFLEGGGQVGKARVVSIGPVTSDTLREHGIGPHVEAQRHDIDGLIAAIVEDVRR